MCRSPRVCPAARGAPVCAGRPGGGWPSIAVAVKLDGKSGLHGDHRPVVDKRSDRRDALGSTVLQDTVAGHPAHAPEVSADPTEAARAAAGRPRGARVAREGARELLLRLYPDQPLELGRDPDCTVV